MTAATFRRHLKTIRLRATDAAALFGVERSTVGRWMKGERKIPALVAKLVEGYAENNMTFHGGAKRPRDAYFLVGEGLLTEPRRK